MKNTNVDGKLSLKISFRQEKLLENCFFGIICEYYFIRPLSELSEYYNCNE